MCEYCIYLKTEKKRRSQPSAGPQPDGRERALSLFEGTTFWFGQDTQNVAFLMEELFSELENRYTGFQLQVELLLQQLLVRLVRNYEEKKETGRASGFSAAAEKPP